MITISKKVKKTFCCPLLNITETKKIVAMAAPEYAIKDLGLLVLFAISDNPTTIIIAQSAMTKLINSIMNNLNLLRLSRPNRGC